MSLGLDPRQAPASFKVLAVLALISDVWPLVFSAADPAKDKCGQPRLSGYET